MQKNVLIALAILGTLSAGFLVFRHQTSKNGVTTDAVRDVYNQWKASYNINVGAAEDDYRFKVFSSNYATINQHNRLLGRGYNMGLNAFSHLTKEEFAATRLGLKLPTTLQARNVTVLPTDNLRTTVDWKSKMNAVKDQGQCGSCWAFSAVGAIEGLHSVSKGNLFNLAEQELVDCSTSYGNNGCNGGLMDYAFTYVQKVGGLALGSAYPYKAADGSCKSGLTRQAKISGYTDVPANSAAQLKAAIAKGPVSVAIEADTSTFQMYSSGIISSTACGTSLDHGVVAVGYSDEGQTPYYTVRNSWGSSWGEKGHVRIAIVDGKGICGIQMMASYPKA